MWSKLQVELSNLKLVTKKVASPASFPYQESVIGYTVFIKSRTPNSKFSNTVINLYHFQVICYNIK